MASFYSISECTMVVNTIVLVFLLQASGLPLHVLLCYIVCYTRHTSITIFSCLCRIGYFMLTEPHGLNYITHCEEEGFHVHPKEPPLYEV